MRRTKPLDGKGLGIFRESFDREGTILVYRIVVHGMDERPGCLTSVQPTPQFACLRRLMHAVPLIRARRPPSRPFQVLMFPLACRQQATLAGTLLTSRKPGAAPVQAQFRASYMV